MSKCKHDWEIPDVLFGDSYFACRLCHAKEDVWQRHENSQAEIAKLKKVAEAAVTLMDVSSQTYQDMVDVDLIAALREAGFLK